MLRRSSSNNHKTQSNYIEARWIFIFWLKSAIVFSLTNPFISLLCSRNALRGSLSELWPPVEFLRFCPHHDSAETGDQNIWRGNKMAAKRFKIDQDSNGKVKRDNERNTTTKLADALIYIVPKKIPKARLQVLNNLAQKKGFLLSERFRFVCRDISWVVSTVWLEGNRVSPRGRRERERTVGGILARGK